MLGKIKDIFLHQRSEFFENQEQLSFDLVKNVQKFVKGYAKLSADLSIYWNAQCYAVFRKVLENNGGIVVGNREKQTIAYETLPGTE